MIILQVHTYAKDTSLTYSYVNSSAFVTIPMEQGGSVTEFTTWQDNSTGTPSLTSTLPQLKVTQTWEVIYEEKLDIKKG